MFGENLDRYRKQAGLTFEQLATKVNDILGTKYNKSVARTWVKGASPKIDVIYALSKVLNIPEQFLFDDSNLVVQKIASNKIHELRDMAEHIKRIPLLKGYAGAGSSGIIDSIDVDKYLYIDICLVKKAYQDKEVRALTIVGDSMIPYVDNNDIVLYHPVERGQYNFIDGKYIIETVNGIMLKNLKFCCNGDIIISSCNKAYRDEVIKAEDSQEYLEIIGVAVGRLLKD